MPYKFDAQLQVQEAIYARLNGNAGLQAMVAGVYDSVPAGKPQVKDYPRVIIGDDTLIDWDTDTSYGAEVTLTIHVWSIKSGRKEAKTILAKLAELLHDQRLAVDGHDDVLVHREFEQTLVEGDGATRHGVARYRIIVVEQEE